jgi:hypothetical protein
MRKQREGDQMNRLNCRDNWKFRIREWYSVPTFPGTHNAVNFRDPSSKVALTFRAAIEIHASFEIVRDIRWKQYICHHKGTITFQI